MAAELIELADEHPLAGAAAAYGLSPTGFRLSRKSRADNSSGKVMAAMITDGADRGGHGAAEAVAERISRQRLA